MDDGSAAVAFDPGDLGVEGGFGDAVCVGGLADGGVPGEEEQAVQALGGLLAAEDLAERFGYLAGVASRGRARAEARGGAGRADGEAVLVGELLQYRRGAADLGGDVGQGAVPGQVLLAQPVQVDADGIGVLGGVRGGLLGLRVEARRTTR